MPVKIVKVENKKLTKSFIDFPHDLYKNDPHYVPELHIAQKEMMDEKKYPFYEYGKVQLFLAYKENKIVGRIAAIDNTNYNQYHDSNVGFFGFFDVVNDFEVAKALLDTATKWCHERGRDDIIGPTNFSTNETAGILVEGHHEPAKIMMTYNKPYYHDLVTQYGFKKEMDLYAYMIYSDKASEKSLRIANALEGRLSKRGITIRNVDMKNFASEVEKIKSVYNSAWENNWGFVPFTEAEFDHLADGLKMLVDPNFVYIAESDGKIIGFSITLPNINEITINFKKGRLFPFGIFKLLLNKNKTQFVRILALGVVEEYRKMGVEAIFFAKNIAEARRRGIKGGEASWILENNTMMCKAAENLNGERYKTYRLYRLQCCPK